MRCLLLAVVAGLAVLAVQVRAQNAVPVHEEPAIEDDHLESSNEDDDQLEISNRQMARSLASLFGPEDYTEAEEERENKRQARARGEDPKVTVGEDKAISVDPKDQARYNNFIDSFLRRLNSYARSQFDPLSIGLAKKDKKGKTSKSKNDKKKKPKKGKKDGKKPGKGTKKGRHPKDLDLDEVALSEAEPEVEEEVTPLEEESHQVAKREVDEIEVFEIDEEEEEETDLDEEDDEVEEESLVRVAREAEDAASDAEDVSRRGKPASGKKGAAKKGGKKKGGKKKGGKKGAKKGGKKGGKKGAKKDGKKGGKKGGKKTKRSTKGARTSRATVKGLASLRRSGDVVVVNSKGKKELRAKFSLGPVELSMNRKFGQGKSAITKEAKATTPEITGKLAIQVAQNGKAKVTNFMIARPSIVQVDGTLHKTDKGGKNDNNFLENSLNRVTPIASQKLKIASRKILSVGEGKNKKEE
ncbi:cylicin-2-like [Palaemon carinicauda]|uniref:cylicin-2-like n=1 Tax=Palaemon carinicauda TaxID=392227 RepID=UPI0035B61968